MKRISCYRLFVCIVALDTCSLFSLCFAPWREHSSRATSNHAQLSTRLLSSTSETQGGTISTFQAFEQSVRDRIEESQQYDESRIAGDIQDVVQYSFIRELVSSKENDHEPIDKLTSQMNDNGGYLIVEMDSEDESERRVLTYMWDSILHDVDFTKDDTNDDEQSLFRQQELQREQTETANTGYRYIEIAKQRRDGILSIAGDESHDSLIAILGIRGAAVATFTFQLLTQISSAVVDLCAIGSIGYINDIKDSWKDVLRKMTDVGASSKDELSNEDTLWSCSVHRMCRYASKADNVISENKVMENIRSHTDWTLVTLVPVSNIAGLEIWNPSERAWTQPEATARKHWETHYSNDDMNIGSLPWNSKYVVVMAGKWLEILTNGETRSSVHRVVASNVDKGKARMSAPFFFRTRNGIAEDVQNHFGAKSGDVFAEEEVGGIQSSVQSLHDFLLNRLS